MQTIFFHNSSLQRGCGRSIKERLFPIAITVAVQLDNSDLAVLTDQKVEKRTDKGDKEGTEECGPKTLHRKPLDNEGCNFEQERINDKGKEAETQNVEGESQQEEE